MEIFSFLNAMVEKGGSDLFFSVGAPVNLKIEGVTHPLKMPALQPGQVKQLAYSVMNEKQISEFEAKMEMNLSISAENLGRFRVNVFVQRGETGMVVRYIKNKIPPLAALGLPPILEKLVLRKRGLVLVTGATGSGKSTTLAALIDHINSTEAVHVMTLEDPIEFVHENKTALINQREISTDSTSFASALKHVLRQDPDVILIGEMRDMESAAVALTAAETGHLVFATLHTQDAPESLERIINLFPTDRTPQIRMQLSLGLRAIVCQKLVPRKGGGRAAALEILLNSPRIKKLILEGDTTKIPAAIQASRSDGMQTFNQALVDLVKAEKVEPEEAFRVSPKPDELRMNLKGIYSGTTGLT